MLVILCLAVDCCVFADDIRTDVVTSPTKIITKSDSLSLQEQRKAVAMAAFAHFFMEPSSTQIQNSLYTVLENDPEARIPLKIALFSLRKAAAGDALVIRIAQIAEHNPHALALNLAVIAYLCEHKKFSHAEKLADNCLAAFGTDKKISAKNLKLYVNIIALRGLIYEKTQSFDAGEDFFYALLDNEQLKDNFTVMQAAVLFFNAASGQSSDTPFLWFWASDRKQLEHRIATLLRRMTLMVDSSARAGTLADIYEKLNLPEQAENVLLDYLLKHDDCEYVMLKLAIMLTRSHDRRALFYWKALLNFNHENLFYLREAGTAALREGYLVEAADYFQVFLQQRPATRSVGLQLAMIYMEQGELNKALTILEKQKPSFFALQGIGIIKLHNADYSGALTAFKAAVALRPATKLTLFFCLNMLAAADYCGKVDMVKKYAKIIADKFPDKILDYGNAVGYTLANNNIKLELAEKLLRQVLKASPSKFAVLDSMAWLLYRKKSYQAALKYIKLSLNAGGKAPHAVIADHAGDIYLAMGDIANALRYWKIALATYGDDLDRSAVRHKISQYASHKTK